MFYMPYALKHADFRRSVILWQVRRMVRAEGQLLRDEVHAEIERAVRTGQRTQVDVSQARAASAACVHGAPPDAS